MTSGSFGECSELTIFAVDSEETAGSETRVIGARSVVVELAEVVWSARVVATAAAVASGKTLSDDF